jgi:F-type H+-transporting ATPase subunit O
MTKINALLAEDKISPITRNLFVTLAANGRIGESAKIVSAFEELIAAAKGVVPVTIISAEALKKKSVDTLQTAVLGVVGAGKTVDISYKVDPSILGGLQVLVGDKFLDLSVSSRVASLGQSLESAEL